jgi:tetratricopeptide (TPR) repeat protein
MPRIEKTVFLSYRRTNMAWARAIFQDLTQHGYDVFLDYTGLASGDFESVILENIRARAHFIVLLTPSALKRCGDSGDWLRREIEAALVSKRNIVPLMLEGFEFNAPSISRYLTGNLAALKQYNGMSVPMEYFDAAMEKLRTRFLNVPLDAVLHPASPAALQAAMRQKNAVANAPPVTETELTAQQWFERAFNATDQDEAIRFYDKAIRLKPDYADAFYNRGLARYDKGELAAAIRDYTAALRLKPDYADAFSARGHARTDKGDLDGAIADCDEAIRLQPDDAIAFSNRGNARHYKGDRRGALSDYNKAIRLKPDFADAYTNRSALHIDKGEWEPALNDANRALGLQPHHAVALNNRGWVLQHQGDLAGALADFTEALRLRPGLPQAIANRDTVLKALADRSKS